MIITLNRNTFTPMVIALVIISLILIVSVTLSSSYYDSRVAFSSSKHGSHIKSNFSDLASMSKLNEKLINNTGIFNSDKVDSEKTKGSGNEKRVPQILSLIGTNLEVAQIPLIAVLHDGNVMLTNKENYPQKTSSLIYNYNTAFNFQFRQGSKLPIDNIKQILVGEVKQYNNLSEALESAYLFKDIRLNEGTGLELQNDGFTYMVIEVQFANSVSGIYATAFENTPQDTKDPTYVQTVEQKYKELGRTILNASKVKIGTGDPFLLIGQSVICHITLNYGFQVCDQNKEGKVVVTEDRNTIKTVEKETPPVIDTPINTNINLTRWSNFTDSAERFSVQFPAHWAITQSGNRFTEELPLVVSDVNGSSSKIQSQLSVNVFKRSQSFKTNQLAKFAFDQLVKSVTGNKLVEPISCNKYTIDVLKACSFVYSGSDKEGKRYGVLAVVIVDKDKSNHIISYRADAVNFDKEQSTMDHIIDSYRLLQK